MPPYFGDDDWRGWDELGECLVSRRLCLGGGAEPLAPWHGKDLWQGLRERSNPHSHHELRPPVA